MRVAVDAEGFREGVQCPECGSTDTITYRYAEGFDEHECQGCGYRSDAAELDALTRYESALMEGVEGLPIPIPRRSIKA